jgi:predicted nucleic acid-binding protein
MRLLLDTSAYSGLLRGDAELSQHAVRASEIIIPVPVLAELRTGFLYGSSYERNEGLLSTFTKKPYVLVADCTEHTAVVYAQLALEAKKQGRSIGQNDLWIAALVIEHQAELLTRDNDFSIYTHRFSVHGITL